MLKSNSQKGVLNFVLQKIYDKHPFLSADAWWKEENKKLNSEYQEKVSSFLLNLIEKDSREQVYEK